MTHPADYPTARNPAPHMHYEDDPDSCTVLCDDEPADSLLPYFGPCDDRDEWSC